MTTRVRGLLNKPLDRLLVAERESRDGRILHYIEGWTAINQANRIFGYDGWGMEVMGEVGSAVMPPTPKRNGRRHQPSCCARYGSGLPPRSDAGCGFVSADTPEAERPTRCCDRALNARSATSETSLATASTVVQSQIGRASLSASRKARREE
jgi:hypothetical protein